MFTLFIPLWACSDIDSGNPYEGQLHTLTVQVSYPEGYEAYARDGVTVEISNVSNTNTYSATTDAAGVANITISNGLYRVVVSDKIDSRIFNGAAEKVKLADSDVNLTLSLTHSKAGSIVIKEIYCGGCTKLPEQGNYMSDQYIILHNNDSEIQYLDGLCFGASDPYNSQANNVWVTQDAETGASVYPDYVPIIQALWQFGGTGTSFPLAPGEDAVLVVCGAIDHAAQYPESVNLNKAGYFVCYNNVYFWNTLYHPAPGNQITSDHYLNVVIKVGQANAYPLSVYSPAVVIFKAEGTTIQEFVQDENNVIQKPGSTVDRAIKIPQEWIMDGVEVFYGGSSNNTKRLSPAIDAGYVTQSAIYTAGSLFRHTDEEASQAAGYEILVDTNNSSNDFYQRTQQSLHE